MRFTSSDTLTCAREGARRACDRLAPVSVLFGDCGLGPRARRRAMVAAAPSAGSSPKRACAPQRLAGPRFALAHSITWNWNRSRSLPRCPTAGSIGERPCARETEFLSAETKPPKPFIEIQSASCGDKALVANLETSGTSLAGKSPQAAQSQRPIIVWLEVRVLPAPPRSPIQTEISGCRASSAELVGFRAGDLSLLTIG